MKKKFFIVLALLLVIMSSQLFAATIQAYKCSKGTNASDEYPFYMAGIKYTEGACSTDHPDSKDRFTYNPPTYVWTDKTTAAFMYNLGKQYKTVSFTIGPNDSCKFEGTITADIYIDNVKVKSLEFTNIDFPIDVTIDADYHSQLKIITNSWLVGVVNVTGR